MFNLPKKTALCILVALGATGCLSTSNDQPQPKEPINTSAQKTNSDKKPASTVKIIKVRLIKAPPHKRIKNQPHLPMRPKNQQSRQNPLSPQNPLNL